MIIFFISVFSDYMCAYSKVSVSCDVMKGHVDIRIKENLTKLELTFVKRKRCTAYIQKTNKYIFVAVMENM